MAVVLMTAARAVPRKRVSDARMHPAVSNALFLEAQLLLVAGGARPGWLSLNRDDMDESIVALAPRIAELGLEYHYFEGGRRHLKHLNRAQFSGHLFYDPRAADPADIEKLKRDGWGAPSSSAAMGRVLGYDCPGYAQHGIDRFVNTARAQVTFSLELVLKSVSPATMRQTASGSDVAAAEGLLPAEAARATWRVRSERRALFWYNLRELSAEAALRAANLADSMRRILRAAMPRRCVSTVSVEFTRCRRPRSERLEALAKRRISIPTSLAE
jgi:hypothetical protein